MKIDIDVNKINRLELLNVKKRIDWLNRWREADCRSFESAFRVLSGFAEDDFRCNAKIAPFLTTVYYNY